MTLRYLHTKIIKTKRKERYEGTVAAICINYMIVIECIVGTDLGMWCMDIVVFTFYLFIYFNLIRLSGVIKNIINFSIYYQLHINLMY